MLSPGGDSMSYDPAGHQASCETAHIFIGPMNSVIIFVVQVCLNCYFARVLFSFEKELRLAGGTMARCVFLIKRPLFFYHFSPKTGAFWVNLAEKSSHLM